MKRIVSKALSIGKTDRRNDDMVFAAEIFGYQCLGIIGDFTSDSPKGVNEACRRHLQEFVAERLGTWREMLLPPERLLPLLVRHTNDWAADYGGKAKTTLIAYIWDLKSELCHYISVGDSGLAVASPQGIRFLREGDRQGLRIAAGFLPGQVDMTVQSAPVAAGETLFAFTDGFWENTATFLNETLLRQAFRGEILAQVEASLQHHILQAANRKDDLSILLMKGESMEPSTNVHSEELSARLRAEVERQVSHAVGDGLATPSPLEQDLVRLLGDAPKLEQHFLQSLMPSLADEVEQRFERVLDERLGQQQEAFAQLLAEQKKQMDRDLALQQGKIQKLERQLAQAGRVGSSSGASGKGTNPAPKGQRPQRQTGRRQPFPASFDLNETRNQWIAGIAVALLVALLGFGIKRVFFTPGVGAKPFEVYSQLKDQAAEAAAAGDMREAVSLLERARKVDTAVWTVDDQKLLDSLKEQSKPQVPAAQSARTPPAGYQPAEINPALLTLMGIKRETYVRQTQDIQKALNIMPTPELPSIQHLSLPNSEDLNMGILTLTLDARGDWSQTRPISKERVAKIWLQAVLEMEVVDGRPGEGTKKRFIERYGKDLDGAEKLRLALSRPEQKQALNTALAGYFKVPTATLDQALMQLAQSLSGKGVGKDKLTLSTMVAGKSRPITAVLRANGRATPLGEWLQGLSGSQAVSAAQMNSTLSILWLSAQAGLSRADGGVGAALKQRFAGFEGQTGAVLFDQTVARWKESS